MKYPPTSLSKSLLDMEVANYSEGLDPTYSTLGFENAEVLYGGGEWWWAAGVGRVVYVGGGVHSFHIGMQQFCSANSTLIETE